MNENPSISAVIPTHNRRAELHRAIQSVLQQTIAVQEIWIIDDASSEELGPFPDKVDCTAIHYFRLPQKANANVARNKGIELANAEYIAFLDSDDEWKPFHIQSFLTHVQPSKEGYFSAAEIIRNENLPPTKHISIEYDSNNSPMNFLFNGGFAQTSSFIILKSALLHCQFNPELKRHQDYDFFVRFHQNFHWHQSFEHTVVLHWESNRKVTRNAPDEMRFMREYKKILDPLLYKRYLKIQYDYYLLHRSPQDYTLHQQELPFIISHLTLREYWNFFKERKNKWQRIGLTIEYFFLRITNYISS